MPALPPDRPGCPKAPGGRRPLPDLAAVRLYLVPDPAPPYDEEVPAGDQGCGGLPDWAPRAASPGAEAPRAGVPRAGEPGQAKPGRSEPGQAEPGRSEPGRSERGRMEPAHGMGRGEPAGTEGRDGRPAQGGSQGIPRPPAAATGTPPGWPGRFAQVLAEALAGSRPPRQLVPWTTQETL